MFSRLGLYIFFFVQRKVNMCVCFFSHNCVLHQFIKLLLGCSTQGPSTQGTVTALCYETLEYYSRTELIHLILTCIFFITQHILTTFLVVHKTNLFPAVYWLCSTINTRIVFPAYDMTFPSFLKQFYVLIIHIFPREGFAMFLIVYDSVFGKLMFTNGNKRKHLPYQVKTQYQQI